MLKHRYLRTGPRLVDIFMWLSVLLLVGAVGWYALSHIRARAAAGPSRVLPVITRAAVELGVPPALRDTSETDDGRTVFTFIIDTHRLELPFANAYLTQLVRQAGGEVVDGADSGRWHRLLVQDQATFEMWEVVLQPDTRGRYAAAKPRLAVIIDDFGDIDGELLREFCEQTDPAVTFAIIPGQPHSRDAMQQATASGHEVMVHMPMEPVSYPRNNPGPNAIYVAMSPREIRQRVRHYINELPDAVGANNHMGSLATADRNVMQAVITELDDAGLYFVDSRTIASSVGYDVALEMGAPAVSRDVFLDVPDISAATLEEHINSLKSLLRRHGSAVVISHCYPQSKLRYLQRFLARVDELDAELTPVSTLFTSTTPELP